MKHFLNRRLTVPSLTIRRGVGAEDGGGGIFDKEGPMTASGFLVAAGGIVLAGLGALLAIETLAVGGPWWLTTLGVSSMGTGIYAGMDAPKEFMTITLAGSVLLYAANFKLIHSARW